MSMNGNRKAFTIVELMLAMSFLGTMLVGIASLTMRITNIYQKGLSIRSIDANGREIISDLTRIIGASRVNFDDINPPVEPSGEIKDQLLRITRSNYYVYTTDSDNRQLGGAFCTGDYSYVWNTAENIREARKKGSINSSNAKTIADNDGIYIIQAGDDYYVPKFARFIDKERYACTHNDDEFGPAKSESGMKAKGGTLFDLGESKTADSITELIEDNESDLALYNFTVYPASQHTSTKQIFYSGMFILATIRGGVNVMANGDFCQGSDDDDGSKNIESDGTSEFNLNDFDYCAVNKFNFSARATGETGINKYGE